MADQGGSCRKLLEGLCKVEDKRRNGTEENRLGVIGGLGCHTKETGPSPTVRGPDLQYDQELKPGRRSRDSPAFD